MGREIGGGGDTVKGPGVEPVARHQVAQQPIGSFLLDGHLTGGRLGGEWACVLQCLSTGVCCCRPCVMAAYSMIF